MFKTVVWTTLNKTPTRICCLLRKNTTSNTIIVSCARNYGTQPIPNLRSVSKQNAMGPMGVFLLIIPLGTFCLGTWQVKRKKWKDDLIETLMYKTRLPPISLPQNDEDVRNLEFRKVIVKGEFDHSGESFLGPRSCLIQGESKANEGKLISRSSDGVSGYLVVTPFILSDTGERILVNRGWIPFTQKTGPAVQKRAQLKGEVELEGILRNTEPKPPFSLINKPDVKVWFVRNVEEMAAHFQSRPVFVDATVESTVPGGPIGGQTRVFLRNEHLSYIITWYSLSAATAFMWFNKFIRR